MRVTQAAARYRPVTIVLETQDEHDMFFSIVEQVAENRINHTPQVIAEARKLLIALENAE
jgi:hypothetical protein